MGMSATLIADISDGDQGRPILSFCLVFGSAEKNKDIFQLTPQIQAF